MPERHSENGRASYTQGARTAEEHEGLGLLKHYLEACYGPQRHLSRAQLAVPRHLLKPFGATLHLDACAACAAKNKKEAGPWAYPPPT